jgi:hypothetical protein
MKSQSSNLVSLRNIEQRQSPVRVDTILSCTRVVSSAAETQLACAACGAEPNPVPTLLLTLMTFQTIFRWARAQTHHPDAPCPGLDPGMGIRMGAYEISREEAHMLKSMLLSRAFERVQHVLVRLRSRVEIVAADVDRKRRRASLGDRELESGWDFEKGEVQNLLGLSQSLLQTSNMFAKRLRTNM